MMGRARSSPARNSATLLVGQVMTKGCFIAGMMLLSRYLDDGEFGLLTLTVAIGQIFFFAADMGVSMTLNRRMSTSRPGMGRLVRQASGLRLAAVCLPGAAAIVFCRLCLGSSFFLPAVFILASFAFDAFSEIGFAVFRGAERTAGEGVSRAVSGVTSILLLVAVTQLDLGIHAAAATYALRSMLMLFSVAIFLGGFGFSLIPSFSRKASADLLRESWSLGVMGLLMIVLQRVDNLVLAGAAGERVVGAWQECYRIVDSLTLLITPALLPGALFPALCRAMEEGQAEARAAMRSIAQLVTGLAVMCLLVFASGGLPVLELVWGGGYLRGLDQGTLGTAYALSLAAIVPAFWMNFLLAGAMAAGRRKSAMGAAAAGLVVATAGNLALVPLLGIEGTATTYLATNLFMSAVLLAALRRWTGAGIFSALVKPSLCALPAVAAALVLGRAPLLLRSAVPAAVFAIPWIHSGGADMLLPARFRRRRTNG